jgi:integrase
VPARCKPYTADRVRGQQVETEKRPLRHLARFILIGLYTGTRAGAIAAASPERGQGRSFVNLENGIFYRLPEGHRITKKRQPPVPIPPRLLAHLRRWKAKNIARAHFVEWNGQPVKSVKTAFKTAIRLAKLSGSVTAHTLRHYVSFLTMSANSKAPVGLFGNCGPSRARVLETTRHSFVQIPEIRRRVSWLRPITLLTQRSSQTSRCALARRPSALPTELFARRQCTVMARSPFAHQ